MMSGYGSTRPACVTPTCRCPRRAPAARTGRVGTRGLRHDRRARRVGRRSRRGTARRPVVDHPVSELLPLRTGRVAPVQQRIPARRVPCDDRAGRAGVPGLTVGAFAEQTVVLCDAVVGARRHRHGGRGGAPGCAVTTGVGAVIKTAKVTPGSSVLVIGLGVSACQLQGARLAGASTIIAVDRNSDKEPAARAAGAHHFVPADQAHEGRRPRPDRDARRGLAFDCAGPHAPSATCGR